MLSEYKGPANSREVCRFMVGEKVTATFIHEGKMYLVVTSGHALIVGGTNAGDFTTYCVQAPHEVQAVIRGKRQQLEDALAELRDLPGVRLP